jgi:hypothetical protein
MAVESSLVARVWFDQRIDQRMMGLASQLGVEWHIALD